MLDRLKCKSLVCVCASLSRNDIMKILEEVSHIIIFVRSEPMLIKYESQSWKWFLVIRERNKLP